MAMESVIIHSNLFLINFIQSKGKHNNHVEASV